MDERKRKSKLLTLKKIPLKVSEPENLPFIRELSSNGHKHTVFFAGKGGVGKTVASCISAVWLASSGYKTLLVTTDPAAHLGDVLGVTIDDHPAPIPGMANLWAAKIDPKAAAEEYKKRILDDAKKRGRPAEAIKTMEEELDSPCTEEMAAFDQFIDLASQSEWKAVVFDTAPTGHTLGCWNCQWTGANKSILKHSPRLILIPQMTLPNKDLAK